MATPKLFARPTKAELAEMAMARRKETAHHEAGHAVMFWLWWDDGNIHNINMRPTTKRLGAVNSYSPISEVWIISTLREKSPVVAKNKAMSGIMKHMAGPAAGSWFNGTGSDWFDVEAEEYFSVQGIEFINVENSDMARAVAAAKALHGDAGEISRQAYRFLRTVAKWTEDAIFHPKAWPMVEALGARLETQQTMRASTAIQVMEQAAGDGWNHPVRLHALGRTWKRRIVLPAF